MLGVGVTTTCCQGSLPALRSQQALRLNYFSFSMLSSEKDLCLGKQVAVFNLGLSLVPFGYPQNWLYVVS